MRVVAVSTSARKGEKKVNQPQIELKVGHGVVGDAHADGTHRQLSLLAVESVNKMRAAGADVHPGDFAENITTEGISLHTLPVGTRFTAGDGIVLELTQIGKECHSGCAIAKQVGHCVMPKEGIFCRIIKGGILKPGDSFTLMPNLSHVDGEGRPSMVDVGAKAETARTAVAGARVLLSAETLALLEAKALPKGDALAVAQTAGILAAKRTHELIPLCHPLAITHADVRFAISHQPPAIDITSSVSLVGRTGVEMEAIIAAQVAAATIYDMCKAVQKDIVITDVRLLRKEGGKSGLYVARDTPASMAATAQLEQLKAKPEAPVRAKGLAVACITLSDKGAKGEREDKSGPALLAKLHEVLPIAHEEHCILPDEPEALRQCVRKLVDEGFGLIVTTGGTGLNPRDLTPEALLPLLTRRLPGMEQAMMAEGLTHTPRAMLSRCLAGTIGTCLVLALPGSHVAAQENLAAVLPALTHGLEKLHGDTSDCGRS